MPMAFRFGIAERQWTGLRQRLRDVETQRERIATGFARGRKIRMEIAAGAGIDRAFTGMRGAGGRGDVLAAAEAGIEDAERFQPGQSGAVIVEMVGLAPDRLFPGKAEPGEVFEEI